MVVHDFDIGWTGGRPSKYDSPLLVDPDRMFSDEIAFQSLETIAGWDGEVR
jgi:hypothetical protein